MYYLLSNIFTVYQRHLKSLYERTFIGKATFSNEQKLILNLNNFLGVIFMPD